MSTITVSTIDNDDELVIAEYYQFEDGWVTFKTVDGKAVVSWPEKLVTKILSNTPQLDLLASAWDDGFSACAGEHTKRRKDPSHPITRVNPYRKGMTVSSPNPLSADDLRKYQRDVFLRGSQ